MAAIQAQRPSRKWPPLVALAVAFLMAFLVFPNPLRVPTNNPTATAEIAPVPGPPQQNQQQANFSETQLASSAGLGAGGQGAGSLRQVLPGKPLPVDKACVVDPITHIARQTEDPLSPPCVAAWRGNNGGSTWQGVTGDAIKIIFYNDNNIEGEMSPVFRAGDEERANCQGPTFECQNIVRTIKANVRYFQKRYQTYGRNVRLIAQGATGATPDARRRDALATESLKPFATVFFGDNAADYFAKLAEFRIPSFGLNFDVPRKDYEKHAPYIWSFMPDQETEAQWSASFICTKLYNRGKGVARFTDDPDLRNRARRFGFIWGKDSPIRGPVMPQVAALLKAELKRQCNLEFTVEEVYDAAGASGGGDAAGSQEAPRIMARMKLAHITTVVCYCIPVQPELTVRTMKDAATGVDYFPEWYWDPQGSAMDRTIWQQSFGKGDERQKSFGTSYFWRQPAFREQYHYQAYLSQEPATVPNQRFNFSVYHVFLNLFTGIQAAGHRLTPTTVEKGMFTFKWINPNYPWVPTGGYGPDGPGTYTFVDTAEGWWWDPNGTPPGGKQGEGCLHVIDEGRRFYWNTWKPGDADLFGASDPCTEDTRKLVDPQPGDLR